MSSEVVFKKPPGTIELLRDDNYETTDLRGDGPGSKRVAFKLLVQSADGSYESPPAATTRYLPVGKFIGSRGIYQSFVRNVVIPFIEEYHRSNGYKNEALLKIREKLEKFEFEKKDICLHASDYGGTRLSQRDVVGCLENPSLRGLARDGSTPLLYVSLAGEARKEFFASVSAPPAEQAAAGKDGSSCAPAGTNTSSGAANTSSRREAADAEEEEEGEPKKGNTAFRSARPLARTSKHVAFKFCVANADDGSYESPLDTPRFLPLDEFREFVKGGNLRFVQEVFVPLLKE
jgi:hypothetical protein